MCLTFRLLGSSVPLPTLSSPSPEVVSLIPRSSGYVRVFFSGNGGHLPGSHLQETGTFYLCIFPPFHPPDPALVATRVLRMSRTLYPVRIVLSVLSRAVCFSLRLPSALLVFFFSPVVGQQLGLPFLVCACLVPLGVSKRSRYVAIATLVSLDATSLLAETTRTPPPTILVRPFTPIRVL